MSTKLKKGNVKNCYGQTHEGDVG